MKYILIPFPDAEEAARFTNSLPRLPQGIRLLDEREVKVTIPAPPEGKRIRVRILPPPGSRFAGPDAPDPFALIPAPDPPKDAGPPDPGYCSRMGGSRGTGMGDDGD